MDFKGTIDGVRYDNLDAFQEELKKGNHKSVSMEIVDGTTESDAENDESEEVVCRSCDYFKSEIKALQKEIDKGKVKLLSIIEEVSSKIDEAERIEKELDVISSKISSLYDKLSEKASGCNKDNCSFKDEKSPVVANDDNDIKAYKRMFSSIFDFGKPFDFAEDCDFASWVKKL